MHHTFVAVKTQTKLHFSQNVKACHFSMNQFSQWHVITFGRFGGIFYVMNATKSAILAGLKSNFYMLVSQSCQKYSPAQNTTTQNTQQPTWDTATLPPSGFAIFCHGNICHGPKSWCRWSLWAHTRRVALGALLLLFAPLFGAPKTHYFWYRFSWKPISTFMSLTLQDCVVNGN